MPSRNAKKNLLKRVKLQKENKSIEMALIAIIVFGLIGLFMLVRSYAYSWTFLNTSTNKSGTTWTYACKTSTRVYHRHIRNNISAPGLVSSIFYDSNSRVVGGNALQSIMSGLDRTWYRTIPTGAYYFGSVTYGSGSVFNSGQATVPISTIRNC